VRYLTGGREEGGGGGRGDGERHGSWDRSRWTASERLGVTNRKRREEAVLGSGCKQELINLIRGQCPFCPSLSPRNSHTKTL
jgi:hypothetical protein